MRILIIEDEHKIAASIKKGLEQESYAVDLAFDGTSGFDLASTEDYDLIVLDRMLPEMDGIEICKKLRSAKNHVPILMLTAKGQLQDKVEGLDAGADDYVLKPFAFEELLARIRALIRRPQQTLPSQYLVSDLVLDTKTHEVTRGGKQLRLSSKEFALLSYLMRHKGQILTKEQIMQHVWDYSSDILPNTIEVYMGYLRNKIDKPFQEPPLLHTLRGFGYKIGEQG